MSFLSERGNGGYMKNLQALKDVMPKIFNGWLSISSAAKVTGYTPQHIRKVYSSWKIRGDSVFIHGNKGRSSKSKIPINIKRHIISLYKEQFEGFNFKFFAEVLRADYDYSFCNKTVWKILNDAGIKSPECHDFKKDSPAHRMRMRRRCEGEMLQLDGTPYQWFKWCGDENYYCIHGAIDDATGKVTAFYMCLNECLYGYSELIRRTFYNFGGGHPMSVYTDRARIFTNPEGPATIEEQLAGITRHKTQWQRMLDELQVKQILAYSPQAKGRVERMWKTVQGRLPWYFKKNGIKTMEAANDFLLEYVEIFNAQFAITPKSPDKVWHTTGLDPDYVLCARIARRTNNANIFKFESLKWEMLCPIYGAKQIELCISDHGIKAYWHGKFYDVQLMEDYLEDDFDKTPHVLKEIIYRYMLRDMKKAANM